MGTLTKIELAQNLFDTLGLSKRESRDIIDSIFEEMRLALEQGEQVKISGFGNFNLRDKKERPGRNPKTGEEISITPRRVVTFHAGHKLKVKVEQYVGTEFE
ncbi:MAG: integration host factor subunit alpha [Gammaproteobacteria bacterium]|nr:integration host factor subunit alpha [Gammaproteobacteria bacterium]